MAKTALILGILMAPGLLAGTIGFLIALLHPQTFPLIAPRKIPYQLALLASQIWIGAGGLMLIIFGLYGEIKERLGL